MFPSSPQEGRSGDRNPPTGRLGILHSSLQEKRVSDACLGWRERSPTFPVGELQEPLRGFQ